MNREEKKFREQMEQDTKENIRLRQGRENEIAYYRRVAHEKMAEQPYYLTGGKK